MQTCTLGFTHPACRVLGWGLLTLTAGQGYLESVTCLDRRDPGAVGFVPDWSEERDVVQHGLECVGGLPRDSDVGMTLNSSLLQAAMGKPVDWWPRWVANVLATASLISIL
jgi:hypothetical protein